MPTIRWKEAQGWANVAAPASFSALASGSVVVSATLTNAVLAPFAEVSLVGAQPVTVVAGGYIGLFVLPLLADGASFPPGGGTLLPPVNYLGGTIGMPPGAGNPRGSAIVPIPPGSFRLAVLNALGNPLAADTAAYVFRYRLLTEEAA